MENFKLKTSCDVDVRVLQIIAIVIPIVFILIFFVWKRVSRDLHHAILGTTHSLQIFLAVNICSTFVFLFVILHDSLSTAHSLLVEIFQSLQWDLNCKD